MLRRNLSVMVGLDAVLAVGCFFLAYLIRFEFSFPRNELVAFARTWPFVLAVKMTAFVFFGLYRGMWRYTSLVDLINVLKAVVTSSLVIIFGVLMVHRFQGYPRSVFVLDGLLTFLAIGGLRVGVRLYFARGAGLQLFPGLSRLRRLEGRKLLLIGAGDAGEKLLREIRDNPGLQYVPVGFLDDDPGKQGKAIHGVPVLGVVKAIAGFPVDFDEILIAIPSARGEEMRRIVALCEQTGKPYRTIPNMGELINGKVSVKTARQVRVEDLLGREQFRLDQDEIARYLHQKRVLVTGAGGSIGSELVRQICRFHPQAMALVEMGELNLFGVETECRQRFSHVRLDAFLADVRDREPVRRAFREFHPEVVFHAAAYKHVPIQELCPWEAVTNNILGTLNVAEAAVEAGVERFVLVSTDKAVRPTSVMGATKRVAEMLVEGLNGTSGALFMAVRFGNVMGSSGSAVPIFEAQIARGGPVTVTHPEVTRYFMSVGEAAQLILQAGALGRGGETFILDMGQPIRIVDLARDMIRLHGFEPEREIPIEFIGLRPGEKMAEELMTEGEDLVSTGHEKILALRGNACDLPALRVQIDELLALAQTFDARAIKAKLKELVPEYTPAW